jgi:RNA polymerase sigma-70 factor (ECF subfamily)
MNWADLPDEALLEAHRQQPEAERAAIVDVLFARHYATVARWCYRFTGDREAAADLAQDVFLTAHRHIGSFRGESRFSTWLYVIVRNASLKWRGRAASAPPTEGDDMLVDVAAVEPSPEDRASDASQGRRLQAWLADTLDADERAVFTLHYGDDMPLDAITRVLRLDNTSGAKAYIVSAKRKLARAAARLRARGEKL